ncbi:chemotaxis protein CheV, partial [Vibrio sp. Vb2362]|nr:chemotaxis protein CheV [Vibrio sp. Vb2362]
MHNLGSSMSGVLNTVDQRTNLVGENRLELLLFTLNSRQ